MTAELGGRGSVAAAAPTNTPRKEPAVADEQQGAEEASDGKVADEQGADRASHETDAAVQAIEDLTNPHSMDEAARKMIFQLRDALRTVEDAGETRGAHSPERAADAAMDEQPTEGVDQSGPELPEEPVAPITDQFPATDGTTEGLHAEVAQRSSDGSDEDMFHKVVSVSGVGISDDHPMHKANAAGVLQEAIQRGLHPRGDVFLVGKVEHDEPLNATGTRRSQYTDLKYAVQVVPASVDLEPGLSTTPRDVAEAQP